MFIYLIKLPILFINIYLILKIIQIIKILQYFYFLANLIFKSILYLEYHKSFN